MRIREPTFVLRGRASPPRAARALPGPGSLAAGEGGPAEDGAAARGGPGRVRGSGAPPGGRPLESRSGGHPVRARGTRCGAARPVTCRTLLLLAALSLTGAASSSEAPPPETPGAPAAETAMAQAAAEP